MYLHTDSRSVFDPVNTMFVALRTGVADGHKYIPDLYARGVRDFIVRKGFDASPFPEARFVFVDDTLIALRDLAAEKVRNSSDSHIIITGSRGKTSVKELIYRTLDLDNYNVARSPRSWNSHIGVPAGLYENAGDDGSIIITEIGIDGPGQAEYYRPLLRPTVGVLTPVTSEHDEAFASHADKIREKLLLLKDADTIIYDDTDPEVAPLIAEISPKSKALPARGIKDLATKAVDEILNVSDVMSCKGKVAQMPLVSTRIDVDEVPGDSVMIQDMFTHDLRSLRDSLDFMRRRFTPDRRNTVILSDYKHHSRMRSQEIEELYAESGRLLRAFGVDRVIGIGPECVRFFRHLGLSDDSEAFESIEDLAAKADATYFGRQTIMVRVDRSFHPDSIARLIEFPRHDTTLEVDLDALIHNYNYYRSLVPSGTGLCAMVKASAYGMGSLEIAKTLQSAGASYLAVAVVDEGVALRKAGITMPVIILNPMTNKYDALFRHHLEPTVFTVDELRRLLHEARREGLHEVGVHIKLDTGMHRLGFTESMIPELISVLRETDGPRVRVKSIFSHLATADCLDMDSYTELQLDAFETMSERIRSALPYGNEIKRHILNTAGIERYGQKGAAYDMCRLGIGLYGISPVPALESARRLKPVAKLVSTVISLKNWPAGTPIGYGCRGVTERDSIIATVPIGYADGVNRHLGRGGAKFIVNGVECPTIGNICMDLCMVDVTDAPDVKTGDRVEIFGPEMPVERLAETLDTIPYEILTSISPRVHRTYLKH